MNEKTFMTVDDVAKEMSVSKSYAYKVVRQLNKELNDMGLSDCGGRVNYELFLKKYVTENDEKG